MHPHNGVGTKLETFRLMKKETEATNSWKSFCEWRFCLVNLILIKFLNLFEHTVLFILVLNSISKCIKRVFSYLFCF